MEFRRHSEFYRSDKRKQKSGLRVQLSCRSGVGSDLFNSDDFYYACRFNYGVYTSAGTVYAFKSRAVNDNGRRDR